MLNHVFVAEVHGSEDWLFDGVETLTDFLSRLRTKGKTKTGNARFNENGFSALIEALINYQKLFISYQVAPVRDSNFMVDGCGVNAAVNKCAVCSILVTNEDEPLTANYNHLTTFLASAQEHYEVKPLPQTLFIYSNAAKIHERTFAQFIDGLGLKDAVVLTLREDICKIIDYNKEFWKHFLAEIKNSKTGKVAQKKTLRNHQNEAVEKCLGQKRGKIILPTGTGKSLIAAALIEQCIREKGNPVIVIASPRIVLTYQLLSTISEWLIAAGIEAQYVNLNSGDFDEDEIKRIMRETGLIARDIPSTTSPIELAGYAHQAQRDNVSLIIGSTYHSAPKIHHVYVNKLPLHVDMILHDEAHNLVQHVGRLGNEIKEEVHAIEGDVEFFFTATEAFTPSEDGSGMNNKALYGERLYTASPREMIQAGEIVPPYIHIVAIDEYKIRQSGKLEIGSLETADVKNNTELTASIIVEAFKEHKQLVKERSAYPNKIGAKILVVCYGEDSLSKLLQSKILAEFRLETGCKLFAISSGTGAYLNGVSLPPPGNGFKEKFMTTVRGLKETDDAIILHIDMIGEGIDVPSLTGVMSFRDLGTIKSSQTLGRAMRLIDADRKKLYSGEIYPCDFDKMIKPKAWVIIPRYSWGQEDMHARIREIARKMKNDLGYIPFENVNAGLGGDGNIENFTKKAMGALGKAPEEMTITHELEQEDFWRFLDLYEEIIKQEKEEVKQAMVAAKKKVIVTHPAIVAKID